MTADRDHGTTQISRAAIALKVEGAPGDESVVIPTLTIMYHPCLRRIGDRAMLSELLASREARVSRIQPVFSPPRQHGGDPLVEPHLSRKPVRLRMTESGDFVVNASDTRTRVLVDGQECVDQREIAARALERGVMIQLADRVLLLFHWHSPQSEQDSDDLGLIGESAAIARVRDEIRQVAELDVTVFVRGETGVGKELVSAAIHRASQRCDGPLVTVNLAAVPGSLAAAELFGTTKGAFTGATRQDGYFRRADGGTLFLDEIGEIPVDTQVMLLRVLETGEVCPLGAQRFVRTDARVVAATDADIEAMVSEGRFRAPLLHRLSAYEIWVPPLRERRDDIARLLVHFLRLELAASGDPGLLEQREPGPWLPMAIFEQLAHYEWPGNVRQLRNVVRQVVIASRGRPVASLPTRLAGQLRERPEEPGPGATTSPAGARRQRTGRRPSQIPEDELIAALQAHDWDLKAAASALDISRSSLYRLINSSRALQTTSSLSADEITACYQACDGDIDTMVERLKVSKPALRRRLSKLGLP